MDCEPLTFWPKQRCFLFNRIFISAASLWLKRCGTVSPPFSSFDFSMLLLLLLCPAIPLLALHVFWKLSSTSLLAFRRKGGILRKLNLTAYAWWWYYILSLLEFFGLLFDRCKIDVNGITGFFFFGQRNNGFYRDLFDVKLYIFLLLFNVVLPFFIIFYLHFKIDV